MKQPLLRRKKNNKDSFFYIMTSFCIASIVLVFWAFNFFYQIETEKDMEKVLNLDSKTMFEVFTILDKVYDTKLTKEEYTKKVLPILIKEYTQDWHAEYIEQDKNYLKENLSWKFKWIWIKYDKWETEETQKNLKEINDFLNKLRELRELREQQKQIDTEIDPNGSIDYEYDYEKNWAVDPATYEIAPNWSIERPNMLDEFTEMIKNISNKEVNNQKITNFKEISANNNEDGIVIKEVVSWTPAEQFWLEVNDIIKEIDGIKIKSDSDLWAIIWDKKNIKLKIIRNNKEIIKQVEIKEIFYPSVTTNIIPLKKDWKTYNIANLVISKFWENLANEVHDFLKKEHKNIDGYMIDLRNNGGGSLYTAENLLKLFSNKWEELYYYSDNYKWEKHIAYSDKNQKYNYFKPTIILQNNQSASASELFTLSLKNIHKDKVIIFGSESYWKWSVQAMHTLHNNDLLKFTIWKWYVWKYKNVSEQKIQPEVEVSYRNDISYEEQALNVLKDLINN